MHTILMIRHVDLCRTKHQRIFNLQQIAICCLGSRYRLSYGNSELQVKGKD